MSFQTNVRFGSAELVQNQAVAANIPGLIVNPAENQSYVVEYGISRRYTGTYAAGNLQPLYAQALLGSSIVSFDPGKVTGPIFATQSSGARIYLATVNIANTGLVANTNNLQKIVRFFASGNYDTGFQTNANAALAGIWGVNNRSILVDSSDKIYLIGNTAISTAGVLRLNADGTLDTAFMANLGSGFNGLVMVAGKILASGKILLYGYFTTFKGNTRNGVVVLNPDGTEDTAFAANIGTGFTSLASTSIGAIAQDSNGKILIGGDFAAFNGNAARKFFVRLNTDGTEDTTFSTNLGTGFVAAAGVLPGITSIVVDSNNDIYLGNGCASLNGTTIRYLLKLNNDGTINTAFTTAIGTGPVDSTNQPVAALLIDQSNRLWVIGSFTSFNANGTLQKLIVLTTAGASAGLTTTLSTSNAVYYPVNIQLYNSNSILISFNVNNGYTVTYNGILQSINTLQILTAAGDYEDAVKGTFGYNYNPNTSTWSVGVNSVEYGTAGSITFSQIPSGQIRYTSTAIAGVKVTNKISWSLRKL